MKKILIIISCLSVLSGAVLSFAASDFGVIRNTIESTTAAQSTTKQVKESSITAKAIKEETTTVKAKQNHGKKETSSTTTTTTISSTTSTTQKQSTSSKESSPQKKKENKKKKKEKKKKESSSTTSPETTSTTEAKKEQIDTANTISINVSVIDSKKPYLLKYYKYDYKDGDTVYDIIKRSCRNNGIPIGVKTTTYGLYINSINGIDEDYFGEKKGGWTYTLNGEMVLKSVDKCEVKNGDIIEFKYVKVN